VTDILFPEFSPVKIQGIEISAAIFFPIVVWLALVVDQEKNRLRRFLILGHKADILDRFL
jgi:hypothetical protein